MNLKFKKFNLVFMSIFIIFSLALVSCSGGDTPAKEQTNTTEKSQEQKSETTLRVFAAASLKESLNEIKSDFEAKENVKLEYNLAASGTLANQIVQADVCDVFISASKSHMKIVSDKNLASDEMDLFKNKLALITPKDSTEIKSIDDLSKAKKIALGEPESVPVGKYSKEVLTNLKLWDGFEKDSKIVYGKDVKAVLNYVETGEIDAGIVYLSDTVNSEKVNVVTTFDEKDHSPIIYPAAVITNSPNKEIGQKFLDYIKANPDKFEKNGFIVNQ